MGIEFFSREETKSTSRPDGKTYSCASCGLYRYKLNPRISPYGKGRLGILNIGEAPGESEDKRGKPWQGSMGRSLQKKFKELGIDLFDDCININAVQCRPTDSKGNNRTPTGYEIACCRRKVLQTIKKYKPKVIILHGGSAVLSVIGYRWLKKLGGITKWRGWVIPDREFNAWVCPVFHPSYVQRMGNHEEVETIWTQDLQRAFTKVKEPFPEYTDEKEQIQIEEENPTDILEMLNNPDNYNEEKLLTFDIESTGLKPYNTNVHEMACISFCKEADKAYTLPPPQSKKQQWLLQQILQNPDIKKVAHNMKFEDTWMKILYGIDVNPWEWDSMLASHVLDNRPGIASLKFQTYVNFGVIGYEGPVDEYLVSPSSNETNSIMNAMKNSILRKEIMTYCGLDSLFTYRLSIKQRMELN